MLVLQKKSLKVTSLKVTERPVLSYKEFPPDETYTLPLLKVSRE